MRRSDPNLSKTETVSKKNRRLQLGVPLFIGKALSQAPLFLGALFIFLIAATGIIPYLMGLAESGKEDHYQQTLTYFDWALKFNPRFADAYQQRAETLCDYAYFKLDNKGTQKIYAQAIADADKAIALDPKNKKYHRTRERVYEHSGNLPEAINEYGRLLALDPLSEHSIRTDRAALYEKLGDEKMARADRDFVIHACTVNINNRPDTYAYSERADAYKQIGQFNNAADDYAKASELAGAQGHSERVSNATMLEKLGKNQDAIASYTKAIELHYDPSKFSKGHIDLVKDALKTAHYRRAKLAMQQKSYALSLKDADALIAMEDKPARHGLRAQILNKMGQYDKARDEERETIAKFDQEIAAHSNEPEKYVERGDVYEAFGKYKSAANDYLCALRLKPDDGTYLSNCGRAFCKAGDYQSAIEYFTRALAANNKCNCQVTENYNGLAEAHLALGQPKLAILDCNKALADDESQAAPYHWRALAYEALGNTERAKADASHAETLDFTPDPEID